ncbi:MAG: sugar transferase [Patescibacteria group bacterium]
MKKSVLSFTVALVPLDFVMLFGAGLAAYFLRTSPLIAGWKPVLFYLNLPLEKYAVILLVIIPSWLLVFALTGLYKMERRNVLEEFFQVVASVSFAMMAVIIYIFIQREWFDSRFIVVATWVFAVVFVASGRWLLRIAERYAARTRGIGLQRALMIGDDREAQALADAFNNNPAFGCRIVKKIPSLDFALVKAAIGNPRIDTVIVAQRNFQESAAAELAEFCQEHSLQFLFVPTLFQTIATNISTDVIGGVPLIQVRHSKLDGWGRVWKRSVDIAGSLIGLVALAPFFSIVALMVKTDSRGPVFVALDRVTQGRRFHLYKFRSMIENAHALNLSLRARANDRAQAGPLWKMKNDPRITRVGRILRKTRIDEFPQLWNVLKGEMSLVGPRPHQPNEVAQYERHHKKLLVVKAGMTGMAQISGSSDLPFEEEVKLDTYYIENWSLLLDIKILLRTVMVMFRDRSAC